MQVLDYSAGFPGAQNIQRAEYVGAVRYIGFPDRRKCTTAAELRDFTAHGLGMALVYEDHAGDWRGGRDGGRAAAQRARAHADAIGVPNERPIYMAVDQDVVTEHEFRAAMEYLRGAQDVLGAEWTGVYGEHDVCARAAAEERAAWFWQCRAWSGTPVRLFAGRHLYQHVGTVTVGGIAADFNDVLAEDWGQHTGGSDMSQADIDNIKGFLYRGGPDTTGPNPDAVAPTSVLGRIANIEGFLFRGGPSTVDGDVPGISPDSILGRMKAMEDVLGGIGAGVAALQARPAADVDEVALAEELAKRGMGGTDPAALAAALIDVLRRTRLDIEEVSG